MTKEENKYIRIDKFGIDKNRIEILPWVEGRKLHLECYKYIDIALDPLPYVEQQLPAKRYLWGFQQ